ncbi:MAG: T9SS type A sorting domain-containing protein [Paludibacteraceae bacterium]|nr:T9SS type A sorting domain-containing protein [Paludibacteraceae bacterium]
MKRFMTTLMVALVVVCAMAADMTGLKIYINPGHGGFDSNDRSIWTIPVPAVWTDSAGYWESKSNFVKGLYLRKMLQDAGATVIFSRERNDSGSRDIDEFKKKHPNATQHEIDSVMVGGDRELSAIAEEANAYKVDHFLSIHSNALNGKTNYLLMLFRGENDKPQTAPSNEMAAMAGEIQIQNKLTTWTSARPIIRGDLTFYGDGWGLGVLRPLTVPGHLSEGSFHDYAPETHRLMNKDYCHLEALRMFQYFHKWFKRDLPQTATISGYVKSKNEKADVLGESKFYYLPNSDDQWKPLNGALVKLLNSTGEVVLQTLKTDDWYNGIFAFYDLAPGTYKVAAECIDYKTDTMEITVAAEEIGTVKMHLQNIHLEVPNYPEPEQAGVVALDTYEFEAGADVVSALPENILRAAYRKGNIYILTSDNKIQVYEPATLTLKQSLTLPAATITDIAFSADDYLVGLADKAVYAWDEDDLNPQKLYETSAAWGKQFAVDGPLWKARFYVVNSAGNGFVGVQYSDGKNSANIQIAEKQFAFSGGDLSSSAPIIMPDNNVYAFVAGKGVALTFNWTGAALTGIEMSQPAVPGATFMRYAGKTYMTMPVLTEGAKASFIVYDISNGINNAVPASEQYPAEGLGTAAVTYQTAMSYVDGYQMNIYLLAEGEGYQYWKSLSNPVANIYAGELNWGEDQISFRLNDDALSVELAIEQEGATVDSYELGALKRGFHTVDNPFKGKEFDAYSVTATGRPVSFPQLVTTDAPEFKFYSIYGVAVDRTPASPYFGRIYVTDRSGGLTSEGNGPHRTTQRGIYILGNDFSDVTSQGETPYNGGIDWGTNSVTGYQTGPRKPSVAPNGEVFISSSVYTSSNVYIMNPAAPAEDFVPVFKGSRKDGGQLKKGMNVVMNPPMDCYIEGNDEDRVLYTMDRNNSLGTVYTNIMRYDIGKVELPWYDTPTATVFDDQLTGSHMENGNGQIYPDARGGWWMSQYRYDGTAAKPSFIHINTKGEIDFNNFTYSPTAGANRWGAMAVTTDGNRLAVMTLAGVTKVYDITYESDGPVPELAYTIEWGATDDIAYTMDFDAAGNLYIGANLRERLLVYSLPNLLNTYTTRISLKHEDPAGVEDVKSSNFLTIYPNPVQDMLFIRSDGKVQAASVYSLAGQLQMSTQNTSSVDVSGLQTGMYMLQVKTDKGTEVKNFIKH